MKRGSTLPAHDRDATAGAAIMSLDGDPEHGYCEPMIVSSVYFALDPDACQVKIGYTARPVNLRLAELQAKRPNLELIGAIRGGRTLERTLHCRFAPHRREAHEWYSSEIAADVLTLLRDEAPTS